VTDGGRFYFRSRSVCGCGGACHGEHQALRAKPRLVLRLTFHWIPITHPREKQPKYRNPVPVEEKTIQSEGSVAAPVAAVETKGKGEKKREWYRDTRATTAAMYDAFENSKGRGWSSDYGMIMKLVDRQLMIPRWGAQDTDASILLEGFGPYLED
jgi:hypothetical protein